MSGATDAEAAMSLLNLPKEPAATDPLKFQPTKPKPKFDEDVPVYKKLYERIELIGKQMEEEDIASDDDDDLPLKTSAGFRRSMLTAIVSKHEGPLKGGLYSDVGTAIYLGGETYTGDFKDGLMHGKGEFQWLDNTLYRGEVNDNHVTGNGQYYWSDGSSYNGQVKNGFRHGEGIFYNPNVPARYSGSWKKGLRHGHGKLSYDEDGQSYYEGEWVHGRRHGVGVMKYASGNTYEGEWKFDKKHGFGSMKWLTLNQMYTGEWENDVESGRGEYIWGDIAGIKATSTPNGPRTTHLQVCNRYIGAFKNGVRHGEGTFFFSNGAVYNGIYDGNRKQGHGTYVYENGAKYRGDFILDRMADNKSWRTKQMGRWELDIHDLLVDEVRDRFPDLHPSELQEKLQKDTLHVSNTLLRFTDEIMQIYYFYSAFHCPVEIQSLKMTLGQIWQLVDDCGLYSSDLTRADVSRLISFHLLNDKEHASKVDAERLEGVHDSSVIVLMREFAEFLVRLAHFAFANHSDYVDLLPENTALPARVKMFLTHTLIPRAWTQAKSQNMPRYVRPKYQRQVAKQMLDKYRDLLSQVFHQDCRSFVDVTSRGFRLDLDDKTISIRQFCSLFKSRNMLTEDFTFVRCALYLLEAGLADMDSHLERSIVFEEFAENILRVGLAKLEIQQRLYKSKLSVHSVQHSLDNDSSNNSPTAAENNKKKISNKGDKSNKQRSNVTTASGKPTDKAKKVPPIKSKNVEKKDKKLKSARGTKTLSPKNSNRSAELLSGTIQDPDSQFAFLNEKHDLNGRSSSLSEVQLKEDLKKVLEDRKFDETTRRRSIVTVASASDSTTSGPGRPNMSVPLQGPGEWTIEDEASDDQELMWECEDILVAFLSSELEQSPRDLEPRPELTIRHGEAYGEHFGSGNSKIVAPLKSNLEALNTETIPVTSDTVSNTSVKSVKASKSKPSHHKDKHSKAKHR